MSGPKKYRYGLLAVAVSCSVVDIAFAEDAVQELINKSANGELFKFASGVPDSPALAIAGLATSDVTQLNDFRKLAISIPSFIGNSNTETLAVDINVAQTLFPVQESLSTLENYSKMSRFRRLLQRTRFSAVIRDGVENDSDASKSQRSLLSFGVSASLLDASDPILKLRSEAYHSCLSGLTSHMAEFLNTSEFSAAGVTIYDHFTQAKAKISLAFQGGDDENSPLTRRQRTLIKESYTFYLVGRQTIEEANIAVTTGFRVNDDNDIDSLSDAQLRNLSDSLSYDMDNLLSEMQGDGEEKKKFGQIASPATELSEGLLMCDKIVEDDVKFSPNLDVGVGILQRGDTDGFNNLKNGGTALWASFRFPIRPCMSPGRVERRALIESKSEERAQSERNNAIRECSEKSEYFVLGATTRVGFGEIVGTGDDTVMDGKADTIQAWAGVEYFGANFRLAGRGGYTETEFDDPVLEQFSKSGARWLVNADYNIFDNAWISASYGKADGTIEALDGKVFMLTLRFSQPEALNVFNLQ